MWFLSPAEIDRVREKRVELEVRVAQAIGQCILGTCGQPLRDAIRVLLAEILQIHFDTLNRLLAEKKKNFAMFVSGDVVATKIGMTYLKHYDSMLTLPVCSDIIRLFGELAEHPECKKLTGSKWAKHEIAKEDLKRGPTYLQPKDVKKKGWSVPPPVGKGLTEKEKQNWEKEQLGIAHRHRIDLEKEGSPFTRSEEPYVTIPTTIHRGVDKHEFGDHSVIGALDRTFGVKAKGADVSGTTTDSIYAMRHASTAASLDQHLDLLMLLPIATMVPAGHHSLIECAYPLSRWGQQENAPGKRDSYIDYHIGYYDTLMPTNCKAGKAELKSALAAFQSESEELHVLIYRDAGQEIGLLMDPDDYTEYNEFKKVARLMSAYGWCVAGGLNRELLRNVLNIYSKPLLDRFSAMRARAAHV